MNTAAGKAINSVKIITERSKAVIKGSVNQGTGIIIDESTKKDGE